MLQMPGQAGVTVKRIREWTAFKLLMVA